MDRRWHPLLADSTPPDVLVLAEAAMWNEQGLAHMRRALRELGGRRVTELREDGTDYLLDVDIVAPRYTGVGGVWSDDTLSWIAYASHEGTVAFGGHLGGALRAYDTVAEVYATRLPDTRVEAPLDLALTMVDASLRP